MEYRCVIAGDPAADPDVLLRQLLYQPFSSHEVRQLRHQSLREVIRRDPYRPSLHTPDSSQSDTAHAASLRPATSTAANDGGGEGQLVSDARQILTVFNPSMPTVDISITFDLVTRPAQLAAMLSPSHHTRAATWVVSAPVPNHAQRKSHTRYTYATNQHDCAHASRTPSHHARRTAHRDGSSHLLLPHVIVLVVHPFHLAAVARLRWLWLPALHAAASAAAPRPPMSTEHWATAFSAVHAGSGSAAAAASAVSPVVILVSHRCDLLHSALAARPTVTFSPIDNTLAPVAHALGAKAYAEVAALIWDDRIDELRLAVARACVGELSDWPIVSVEAMRMVRQESVRRAWAEMPERLAADSADIGDDNDDKDKADSKVEVEATVVAGPPPSRQQKQLDEVATKTDDANSDIPLGQKIAGETIVVCEGRVNTTYMSDHRAQVHDSMMKPMCDTNNVPPITADNEENATHDAYDTKCNPLQINHTAGAHVSPMEHVANNAPHSHSHSALPHGGHALHSSSAAEPHISRLAKEAKENDVVTSLSQRQTSSSQWTWRRHPRTGRVFFVHRRTRHTQYRRPASYDGHEPPMDVDDVHVHSRTSVLARSLERSRAVGEETLGLLPHTPLLDTMHHEAAVHEGDSILCLRKEKTEETHTMRRRESVPLQQAIPMATSTTEEEAKRASPSAAIASAPSAISTVATSAVKKTAEDTCATVLLARDTTSPLTHAASCAHLPAASAGDEPPSKQPVSLDTLRESCAQAEKAIAHDAATLRQLRRLRASLTDWVDARSEVMTRASTALARLVSRVDLDTNSRNVSGVIAHSDAEELVFGDRLVLPMSTHKTRARLHDSTLYFERRASDTAALTRDRRVARRLLACVQRASRLCNNSDADEDEDERTDSTCSDCSAAANAPAAHDSRVEDGWMFHVCLPLSTCCAWKRASSYEAHMSRPGGWNAVNRRCCLWHAVMDSPYYMATARDTAALMQPCEHVQQGDGDALAALPTSPRAAAALLLAYGSAHVYVWQTHCTHAPPAGSQVVLDRCTHKLSSHSSSLSSSSSSTTSLSSAEDRLRRPRSRRSTSQPHARMSVDVKEASELARRSSCGDELAEAHTRCAASDGCDTPPASVLTWEDWLRAQMKVWALVWWCHDNVVDEKVSANWTHVPTYHAGCVCSNADGKHECAGSVEMVSRVWCDVQRAVCAHAAHMPSDFVALVAATDLRRFV